LPLTPTSPIISYGNIFFDLRPLFEERNWRLKQGIVYTASQFTPSHIWLNALWQVAVHYANPYLFHYFFLGYLFYLYLYLNTLFREHT
jgi:hypothetical protein